MEEYPKINPEDNVSSPKKIEIIFDGSDENLIQDNQEDNIVKNETILGLKETTDETSEIKKKSNKKIIAVIGGAALALTITVITLFEIGAFKKPGTDSTTNSDNSDPDFKSSQTDTESSVDVNPEKPLTVDDLEIPASFFSNPELLSKKFIDDLTTKWFNHGATIEAAKDAYDFMSFSIYAKQIAAEYDKIFIEALFIKDWKSKPNLVKYADRLALIHGQTLSAYFATSGAYPIMKNEDDIEPYMRGTTFVQVNYVKELSDGSISIATTEYDYDNADKNRIGEYLSDGVKVKTGYTLGEGPTRFYVIEDGKIKLSDITFSAETD
jgi:hypothetical protein